MWDAPNRIMRPVPLFRLLFLLPIAAVGCEADRTTTVATYPSGDPALGLEQFAAARGGTYYLTDWNWQTLRRVTHREGDAIGFARAVDGRLAAVVGSERWPLDDGCYCWRYARPATAGDLAVGVGQFAVGVVAVQFATIITLLRLPFVVG